MIGKILKTMRKENGLSQENISKKISFARNTISQYENETLQPTFETIEKIANACDYEIIFRSKKDNNHILNSENIKREEI